ncbi:NADH dehydrogenase subunit [Trifolium repens]|nr:NADH dehydrogenase subunit [Trifolium repens]
MKKGAASGRAEWMSERCHGVRNKYPESHVRQLNAPRGRLPLWRPLTLPTLHSHSKLRLLSKMHCDFLFCGRTGIFSTPGREDKDFYGGLYLVKPKTPQDKGEGDIINRTWLGRDNFTYFCQILLLLSTAGTISMCFDSSEQERFDAFEFIVLIPLPTRSMLFMISAHDSIAMYLAIEPQSLCFYVMAASKRKSEFSTEAGSKYLILGAFSSGILLFGQRNKKGPETSTRGATSWFTKPRPSVTRSPGPKGSSAQLPTPSGIALSEPSQEWPAVSGHLPLFTG